MDKFRIKIRIFLCFILAGVFFWLLCLKIVPGGEITYVYDLVHKSDFISKLSPEERLGILRNSEQEVIGEPLYFTLRSPRPFQKAELTLKYKNPDKLPIIEAGVLVDGLVWRHKTEPIENYVIDQVFNVWDTIKKDRTILLQKEPKYENIDQFLENPPESSSIATYNFDLGLKHKIDDYEAQEAFLEVKKLRGSWQFFTYIKNEPLDIQFEFSDLDENDDADDINLFLYYQDRVIDSRQLEDRDRASGNIKTGFDLSDMPEGVYKVELRVNDDIVTESILSRQQKMAFLGKIELLEAGRENLDIFTNGKRVQITTTNPGSLQTVGIVELYSPKSSFADVVNVNETYKQFESRKLSGISNLKFSKDGVIISTDGVLAFAPEALIDPRYKKLDADLVLDEEGIGYIIANYDFPDQYEDWNIATVDFDLTGAYQEAGKYGFMISIPGLRADDDIDDSLEIGEIRIKLKGRPLWNKIKEIFNF